MDTQPQRIDEGFEVKTCEHGIELTSACVRCDRPSLLMLTAPVAREMALRNLDRLHKIAQACEVCVDRILSLTLEADGEGSILIKTGCEKCGRTLEAKVKISGQVIDYVYSCQANDEPFDWSRLNPALCGDCPHEPHRPGCCAHCKCGELGRDVGSMRRMQATLDRATNLDAEIVDCAVRFVEARVARAKAQDARTELLTSETCSRPELLLCGSGPTPIPRENYCDRCRRAADLHSAFKGARALQRKHARKLQKLVEKRAR